MLILTVGQVRALKGQCNFLAFLQHQGNNSVNREGRDLRMN